jgi:hypothetical protein
MKPRTLLLLVLLLQWDAEGAPSPSSSTEDGAPRADVYPLALRYREQAYEQIRPVLPPPSLYHGPDAADAVSPQPTQDRAWPAPVPPASLYVLMSLQL